MPKMYSVKDKKAIIEFLRPLYDAGHSYIELADCLNRKGFKTPEGKKFTNKNVNGITKWLYSTGGSKKRKNHSAKAPPNQDEIKALSDLVFKSDIAKEKKLAILEILMD